MPHTINGIGTWYYGKERVLKVFGTCSQCGSTGQLISYDATNYFVFLFVPILPLGKYRIIEECPVCRQHRRVKLKEWEESKAKAVAEVREQLQSDGDRNEAAAQALQISIGFQDEPMYKSVAGGLAAGMTDESNVQTLLGAAHSYFGHDEEAVEPLRRAIELDDDSDRRHVLASTLIRLRRPDEAEEVLKPILANATEEQVGLLVMLAEGYQTVGRHDRAIELFEQCVDLMPALASDKEYQKLLKRARKYEGSDKPVVSQALSVASGDGYKEGGRSAAFARWLFPAILAIAACGYAFVAWRIGQGRQVYVVNGLATPYIAVINGESVPLPAEGRVDITIPEGSVSVGIEGRANASETVEVSTGFLSRPFNGDVFVINPDRAAILAWEKQWYGSGLGPDEENDWRPSIGKLLHRFDEVDFEFREFPEQLQVSNKSKSTSRTRVYLQRRSDPTWPLQPMLSTLMTSVPTGELAEFARYWATGEPENEAAVGLWSHLAEFGEWSSWAQPLLDRRPVLIEVHRGYQSLVEKSDPDRDLAAEYRRRLEADQNDAALKYLVARVTDDPHESRTLLQEAAGGENPAPRAVNALAFDYLVQGEFEDAARYARQAAKQDPQSIGFHQVDLQAALATKEVSELLADVDRRLRLAPHDIALIQEKLSLLCATGDFAAAETSLQQSMAPFRSEAPMMAPMVEAALRSQVAYARGDRDKFIEHTSAVGGEDGPSFVTAVTSGDAAGAATALDAAAPEGAEETRAANRLLVYLLFNAEGAAGQAQTQLDAAIEILSEGRKAARQVADGLTADTLTDDEVERLVWLSTMPEDKRTFLTALGVRHPEHQDRFFELARKLNYEQSFPYLTLREILQ